MAKPKIKDEKAPAEGRPRRDKAAEAEAQLRAYHALGIMIGARVKEGRLDAETVRKLGEESGHGADNMRKSRVFAAKYTANQLDELCKLRTPVGMPLPWRHVRQLLMLTPGEGRDSLQRKAAERGWSLEDLVAAIPKKYGGRRRATRAAGRSGAQRAWRTRCGRSCGTATSGCGGSAARRGPLTTGSKARSVRRAPAA